MQTPPEDLGGGGLRNDELLVAFSSVLAQENRAAGTIRTYALYCGRLVEWLGDRSLAEVRIADVDLFLVSWEQAYIEQHGKPPSARCVRNTIIALRSFFAYLESREFVERNPMRFKRPPKLVRRRNDWLSESEDALLFAALRGPRERVVVPLLRHAGLRRGEAIGLACRDVCLSDEGGEIIVRHSKTENGLRRVPVVPVLRPYLDEWIARLHAMGLYRADGPLLVTNRGTRMTDVYVWGVVKRAGARAGIRTRTATDHARVNRTELTPHTLRRTFGSSLLNQGVRLEVVSKVLGHSNSAVTEQCYAELLQSTISREILSAFD
jgi:site-specific recombinase XerD